MEERIFLRTQSKSPPIWIAILFSHFFQAIPLFFRSRAETSGLEGRVAGSPNPPKELQSSRIHQNECFNGTELRQFPRGERPPFDPARLQLSAKWGFSRPVDSNRGSAGAAPEKRRKARRSSSESEFARKVRFVRAPPGCEAPL